MAKTPGKSAKSKPPPHKFKGKAGVSPVETRQRRTEAYERHASAVAAGEALTPSVLLTGQARRAHVRSVLREDHTGRIANQSAGVDVKFDKLAASLFNFFRGAALLFYRDMAGADAEMPTVLVLGDVHPSNFGVMPNADNVPVFGVNDFDEACYAPFTWDLKRGAVGFLLAAEEHGQDRAARRRIVKHFVKGYLAGMARFADGDAEMRDEIRADNCPKILKRLFADLETSRANWLADDYLDAARRGFRANDDLTPISSRRDEFQQIVDRLIETNGITPPEHAGDMRVKDVAIRHRQGMASLGLPRFYVMLEGPAADGGDDVILELKRARQTALLGLVPPSDFDAGEKGERIVHAQSVHLINGDALYGEVMIDGQSFMSRERAPCRDDMDLDGLSSKGWRRYANVCGRALAQAHARSEDAGHLDYDVDAHILEAVRPKALFLDDLLRFADEVVERLRQDHAWFQRDHRLGAFETVDKIHR